MRALLLFASAIVLGCAGEEPFVASDSSSGDDASSTGESSACSEACADTSNEAGISRCYACRCKVAFDDWLPAREELQCGVATPIVTYTVDTSSPEVTLAPAPIGSTRCANTSLFTGSCTPGSRVGQLEHGDVMVRWICRDPYLDLDGRVLYHDVGIIGQNVRTGAACFWDDINDVTHDDDLPQLDLETASAEDRARFEENFYFTDGENCTSCHDHDPFIYTPYLQSTNWKTVAAAKGPYGLLDLEGEVRATGNLHLVSPRAAPCTSCHRLGNEKTCTTLAPDALAAAKDDTYEQAVLDAAQPGSPHWRLAYWMPNDNVADFGGWQALYEDARAHILACCATPGEDVGDCRWEAVPAQ
ncbi:MAG TPA: hypothetical protein VG755_24195 [Nannocystaceae bacterium]|nr:hypothetical protein [Nannocystaceae bacterium]